MNCQELPLTVSLLKLDDTDTGKARPVTKKGAAAKAAAKKTGKIAVKPATLQQRGQKAMAAEPKRTVGDSLSDTEATDGSHTTMGESERKPKARGQQQRRPPAMVIITGQTHCRKGTIGNEEESGSDTDSSEDLDQKKAARSSVPTQDPTPTPVATAKKLTRQLTTPNTNTEGLFQLSAGQQKDSTSPAAMEENAWLEKNKAKADAKRAAEDAAKADEVARMLAATAKATAAKAKAAEDEAKRAEAAAAKARENAKKEQKEVMELKQQLLQSKRDNKAIMAELEAANNSQLSLHSTQLQEEKKQLAKDAKVRSMKRFLSCTGVRLHLSF